MGMVVEVLESLEVLEVEQVVVVRWMWQGR